LEKAKVLIGGPISSYKEKIADEFLRGIKDLTYKNKKVVLMDNSPEKKMFERIKKVKEVEVIKTEHLQSIMEMVIRDRNELRRIALEEGFDYFLSLEQDIIMPKNGVQKLISNGKEVCNALYFGWVEKAFGEGKTLLERAPMFYLWFDEELKKANLKLKRQLSFEDVFPSRLFKVMDGGLGCTLIKRGVLEKIKFFVDTKFKAYDDVFFCDACAKKGIDVWLDSSVVCRHLFSPWAEDVKKRTW
jgi:hypothetical protein